jgi:hypothetical protein
VTVTDGNSPVLAPQKEGIVFQIPHPVRARLTYANVIGSLALFIALGGTAAAAVTLDRDSVGSPQIRKAAVRSPEIANDAVRSPEIRGGAIRSSEIRDGGIKADDISARARAELGSALKIAEDDNEDLVPVPRCDGRELSACPDNLQLHLASAAAPSRQANPDPTQPGAPTPGPQVPEVGRNWLIEARLHVAVGHTRVVAPATIANRCGLVNSTTARGRKAVLDQVRLGDIEGEVSKNIALSAIVTKRAKNPTLALRCTSQNGDRVIPSLLEIRALEVGTVTTG